MRPRWPIYLANKPVTTERELVVHDKFTGAVAAQVSLADRVLLTKAIEAAVSATAPMRAMPAHKRQKALLSIVDRLNERGEEFAQVLCAEAGKPIRDSRGEVARAIDTFRIAAEEAVRITGEYLALDISERAEGYSATTRRFPIGPCTFITPFNFPLNLVAHKVAPAIAMGCPFVLKPAPQAPMSALMLGEILADTDLPPGSFSIVPCEVADAALLVEDERIKLLSFTGSAAVGWSLKSKAGKKKVVLELGGNAACIVDRDADVDAILPRIVFGAFYQSGQSCISIQRLIVHESVYEPLKAKLIGAAIKLKAGDPRDESTFLGPLISNNDVARIQDWIDEAVSQGAKVLCGGKRPAGLQDKPFYEATILEGVPSDVKLTCEEVFGPVMTIQPFSDFEEAIEIANASRYGLQAGVFTKNVSHAQDAFENLEVGGVIINDIPSMRIDSMPYGGVKDSGLGREGVRYAMAEMSELRAMVIKR